MKKTLRLVALPVIAALIASCSTKETKSYDPTKPVEMIEALSNDISSNCSDWSKEDWDNAADNLETALKSLPDPMADDEATIISSSLSRISVYANRHKRLAASLIDVISEYDDTEADEDEDADADVEATITEATPQQAATTNNQVEAAAPVQAQPVAAPAPPQPAVAPPSIPKARVPAGLLMGHVIREGGYTNVRQGPGTNYGIVQKIKDGSPIYYTNYNSNWRVVYDNAGNALGYMHASKVIPDGAPVARSNTRGGVVYGTPYDWLSSRYVTHNDLASLNQGQLRVLRNSIYARHGRKFKDASLRQYFNSQPWYNGYRNEISAGELNKYESYNINFIQKYE